VDNSRKDNGTDTTDARNVAKIFSRCAIFPTNALMFRQNVPNTHPSACLCLSKCSCSVQRFMAGSRFFEVRRKHQDRSQLEMELSVKAGVWALGLHEG
jgi:hypothetical protein